MELTADQVKVILDRVLPATSKLGDILGSVHFRSRSGILEACATDGSRMSWFKDTVDAPDQEFLVSGDTMRQFAKLWRQKERESVVIQTDNGDVRLYRNDRHQVKGRLVSGEYPRYQELFPSTYRHAIYLPTEKDRSGKTYLPLLEHARRLRKIGELDNSKFITGQLVILTFEYFKGEWEGKISTNHPCIKYQAELPVMLDMPKADSFQFALNAGYLETALEGTKKPFIRYTSPLKPVEVNDQDDRVRHLIMPVQVRS